MKKFISTALILVFLFSMTGISTAKESIIFDTQSSSIFWAYGSGINYRSDKLECTAYSDTFDFTNQSIKMELQKYDGGWTTVETWTKSSNSTMTINIVGYYSTSAGMYRVKSTHSAGEENKISYSETWEI